jgi:FkbM family methyltransferase
MQAFIFSGLGNSSSVERGITHMNPQEGICVEITGGVKVCVPDDIRLLTPYVLQEQLDWFEDEIKFFRRLIKHGNHVVDVGANYGVYSLTAALLAGPEGSVTAFEPLPATAGWLYRSIEENGFGNIRVVEAAVSNHSGYGTLQVSQNSELNRLVTPDGTVVGESVVLTTLDDSMVKHGWPLIDFVKIDAEGYESSVIEGGRLFFEKHSPLVMLEIKTEAGFQLGPIQQFESMGYSAFRLVPGLDMLGPFSYSESVDIYQLNLFCCKPERAQHLEDAGWLTRQVLAGLPDLDGDEWAQMLEKYPYGREHVVSWQRQVTESPVTDWGDYRRALNAYAYASSTRDEPSVRYACLTFAYHELTRLLECSPTHSRLLSLVRVATDFGHRQQAITALERMIGVLKSGAINVGEPFLPVSPELETISPAGNFAYWIVASVYERYAGLGLYSGYYSSEYTVDVLSVATKMGFSTPAIDRRLNIAIRHIAANRSESTSVSTDS